MSSNQRSREGTRKSFLFRGSFLVLVFFGGFSFLAGAVYVLPEWIESLKGFDFLTQSHQTHFVHNWISLLLFLLLRSCLPHDRARFGEHRADDLTVQIQALCVQLTVRLTQAAVRTAAPLHTNFTRGLIFSIQGT